MPHATIQHLRVRAVVDGQIYLDFGNYDIAYYPVPGDVQLAIVILGSR